MSDIHENNLQQTYEIESEKDLVFLSLYKKRMTQNMSQKKQILQKSFIYKIRNHSLKGTNSTTTR